MAKLTHEQMMEQAWKLIKSMDITDDRTKLVEDGYLVENIYAVRDAFYADLEDEYDPEDESLEEFFIRNNIKFEG